MDNMENLIPEVEKVRCLVMALETQIIKDVSFEGSHVYEPCFDEVDRGIIKQKILELVEKF